MLQQVFGLLEAFGQLFADGLLDDARPGEADQRPGLGQMHIAQHGVGGRHPAGGRMGQHHDIGQPGLLQILHGDGRARHLHERQDGLLHARPAGGDEEDEGRLALYGLAHGGDDGLAHGHAHGAAHELEVLHTDDHVQPVQLARPGQDGVVAPGLGARRLQPVGVFLVVAEFQRIAGYLGKFESLVFAAVEHVLQPLYGRHAHVIARFGHHPQIGFQILVEHHLARLRAGDPHVLRHLALLRAAQPAADFRPDEIVDPVHGVLPAPAIRLKSKAASPRPAPAPAPAPPPRSLAWAGPFRPACPPAPKSAPSRRPRHRPLRPGPLPARAS